jgi:hypothetical protein
LESGLYPDSLPLALAPIGEALTEVAGPLRAITARDTGFLYVDDPRVDCNVVFCQIAHLVSYCYLYAVLLFDPGSIY